MDYTASTSYATHAGTGHRMHQDATDVPTVWSAADANMLIWSLMKLIEGAGVSSAAFDPANSASYNRVLLAVQALAATRSSSDMAAHLGAANPHPQYVLAENLAGLVASFALPAAPAGWLECNGAAVSRSTYARLYSAIGNTYGSGDGSTTFNLPDLRGEFIRGWDHGRGVDAGRGFSSWQSDDLKSHSHTIPTGPYEEDTVTTVTNGGAAGATPVVTAATGGAETRPRNVAMMYCIHT